MITVDSDFMMRKWDLSTSLSIATVLLQKASICNDTADSALAHELPKLEYANMMNFEPYHMAVADDQGNITINSMNSGAVLFTVSHS